MQPAGGVQSAQRVGNLADNPQFLADGEAIYNGKRSAAQSRLHQPDSAFSRDDIQRSRQVAMLDVAAHGRFALQQSTR